jgi:anti-sigma factor ChrR (cupin superfamily)
MRVNADFDQPILLRPEDREWIRSPAAGVERQMLDRIGEEVARATSIVRYIPGSSFAAHDHALGEEFIVLDGAFADEHGVYPAGTYVRNPPGTSHRPTVPDGCVILVKLRQFHPDDLTPVAADMNDDRAYSEAEAGVRVLALHAYGSERVSAIRLDAGTRLRRAAPGGAEFFVLAGAVEMAGKSVPERSWSRSPPGQTLDLLAGDRGAHLWLKTGHLNTE